MRHVQKRIFNTTLILCLLGCQTSGPHTPAQTQQKNPPQDILELADEEIAKRPSLALEIKKANWKPIMEYGLLVEPAPPVPRVTCFFNYEAIDYLEHNKVPTYTVEEHDQFLKDLPGLNGETVLIEVLLDYEIWCTLSDPSSCGVKKQNRSHLIASPDRKTHKFSYLQWEVSDIEAYISINKTLACLEEQRIEDVYIAPMLLELSVTKFQMKNGKIQLKVIAQTKQ